MPNDALVPRIVGFSKEFAPAFAALNRAWIECHFTMEAADWNTLDDPEAQIVRTGGQVFFALLNDTVVGTAAAVRESDGRFELSKMAVDPAFQGHGIGQRLAVSVIDFARSQSATTVFLYTNSRLDTALRLYERLGFQRRPMPAGVSYVRADVYMEFDYD